MRTQHAKCDTGTKAGALYNYATDPATKIRAEARLARFVNMKRNNSVSAQPFLGYCVHFLTLGHLGHFRQHGQSGKLQLLLRARSPKCIKRWYRLRVCVFSCSVCGAK
eukprot:scaffold1697_cov180-Amphora_coffeaeformis.AAC.12